MTELDIQISPPVTNADLHTLFATAWKNYEPSDFEPVLKHSLLYVCAYVDAQLVGFVNIAWDGRGHAFLLDTTVHADFQRQGIGRKIVIAAIEATRARGIQWLHVDYEPHLDSFYKSCGFRSTLAGLVKLNS